MKKTLRFLLILAVPTSFLACSEDSEPDPHQVGVWILESSIQISASTTNNWWAGRESSAEAQGISRTLTLVGNGTYTERLERTGASTQAAQGTWSMNDEGTLLTLQSEESDAVLEYDIVQNSQDLLKISIPGQTQAVPNSVIEEKLAEFNDDIDLVNAFLSSDEADALLEVVGFDFVLNYARQPEQ